MNEVFMKEAIKLAKKASFKNEVPVGAVIILNNKIIAKAYNKKESTKCCINHAEIIAIKKATKKLKNWRLVDCELYVTLEPCPMCASAIKQSRISKVYCGLEKNDLRNQEIIKKIFTVDKTNPSVEYKAGYFNEEILKIMSLFFKNKRP